MKLDSLVAPAFPFAAISVPVAEPMSVEVFDVS
jgi:hypothetical protein